MQQCVGQRQAGIDRITRGAAVAPGKAKRCRHDGCQAGKVAPGGGAFTPAQAGQVWEHARAGKAAQVANAGGDACNRVKQGFPHVRAQNQQVLQGFALAGQLGKHQGIGPLAAPGIVQYALRLAQAHGSVVMVRAEHNGNAARLPGAHQHGGAACLSQLGQYTAVKLGVCAMNHAAVYQLDGYGASALARLVQRQRFAFGAYLKLGAVK